MNISDIKVSIIIPVYNAEDFLKRCIDSVRVQTHKNLQIILIDDGSSDSSPDICEKYKSQDSRIEVYHTDNGGSVAARKAGLSKVNGEYVGFVDADDYIDPNMFNELLQTMIETNADFIHSGYIEKENDRQRSVCFFDDSVINLDDCQCKVEFMKNYIFNDVNGNYISPSIWSKLFKQEFIVRCFNMLADDQQYGEDLLCLCRCIMECHRVVLSRKTMYHYIIGRNTLSHVNYDEYMIKEVELWASVIAVLREYRCFDLLKEYVYRCMKNRMIDVILADSVKKIPIPQFYYKNMQLVLHKKIVIFGAGKVGRDYYTQISKYKNCEIVAWIDSKWYEYQFDYAEVTGIEKIFNAQWDLIIVAVKDKITGGEITDLLVTMGVDAEKICWQEPGQYY